MEENISNNDRMMDRIMMDGIKKIRRVFIFAILLIILVLSLYQFTTTEEEKILSACIISKVCGFRIPCQSCKGSGGFFSECPKCNGSGYPITLCLTCTGTGFIQDKNAKAKLCPHCKGSAAQ